MRTQQHEAAWCDSAWSGSLWISIKVGRDPSESPESPLQCHIDGWHYQDQLHQLNDLRQKVSLTC